MNKSDHQSPPLPPISHQTNDPPHRSVTKPIEGVSPASFCRGEVSQHLLEASLFGDLKLALELIVDPSVDVNFVGTVCLKSKKIKMILCDESVSQVRVKYEFKTDVTALFLAIHSSNVSLMKKLLMTLSDLDSLSLKIEVFYFFYFIYIYIYIYIYQIVSFALVILSK